MSLTIRLPAGKHSALSGLLEDPEREFVAATFLELELLPQPTVHKRKADLWFVYTTCLDNCGNDGEASLENVGAG